jgi:hypothetical protein
MRPTDIKGRSHSRQPITFARTLRVDPALSEIQRAIVMHAPQHESAQC